MWIRSVAWMILAASVMMPAYAPTQRGGAHVEVLGEYSNMRFTEEHAYGYTAQLWREGDRIFGLFLSSAGLAGDTPTGMLENSKFDPRSGKLSFTAKLTMGVAGNGQPSKDLFEFNGTLKGALLAGSLQHRDLSGGSGGSNTQPVRLNRQAASILTEPASFEDWARQAREILKFRGPKW